LNREQEIGDRGQGTGNREQGTGNREQGTALPYSVLPVLCNLQWSDGGTDADGWAER
jgi:hypothetical protein